MMSLRTHYKHSSTNSPSFELSCISRFLSLHRFVSNSNHQRATPIIESIAHVDMDLVLLSRNKPPMLSPHLHAWAVSPYSSYMVRFPPTGLATFVQFTVDFYARAPKLVLDDIRIVSPEFATAHVTDNGTRRNNGTRRSAPCVCRYDTHEVHRNVARLEPQREEKLPHPQQVPMVAMR